MKIHKYLFSKGEMFMTFKDLGLCEDILKAINNEGFNNPSPIQEEAIPYILEGRDVLGCAQTGTGKTAAFALPLINHLINDNDGCRKIKTLVLTPTRELAIQVRDNFRKFSLYTNLKCSVVFGGVNQRSQVEVLKKGVDILIATPGRLLDLINQRYIKLDNVKTLVLDEADTMLDMGFIHDVKKIISYIPVERQILLFSATMPDEIKNLASSILNNYVTIKVNNETITVDKIKQSVYFIDKANKSKLLLDLLKLEDIKSVLVFTRTKHGANKLFDMLKNNGVKSDVIHGDKSQNARVAALSNFKNGKNKVLVATDVAARGIDINELSHVINFEIPEKAETYVHRIGRTGRAGFSGSAISFCNANERKNLKDIEKLIKQEIDIVDDHDYPAKELTTTSEKSNNRWQNKKKFNKSFKHNHIFNRVNKKIHNNKCF